MRKFVIEQGLVKLSWSRLAVCQPQPTRVRHLFMVALTQYKLGKLNDFVLKVCTHLYQFHHRCLKEKSYCFSGCLWHSLRFSAQISLQPILHHSLSFAWGFRFSLGLKWQICSVKCKRQQRLHKRCALFSGGKIGFDMFLAYSRSSQLTF